MKLPEDLDNIYLLMLLMASAVCYADEQHRKGEISDEEYEERIKPFREYIKSLPEFNETTIRNPFAGKPMIDPDCCCV